MPRRPVYESSDDRKKEKSFAAALEDQWGCVLKKTRPFYHVDFMALSNAGAGAELKFFVEVKHRKIEKDRFPTYMLALMKWVNMNTMRRYSGLPVFLAIRYLDQDAFINVTDETFPVSFMGRTDRGDAADMEPCVMIPIDRLMPIESMGDV